MHSDHNDVRDGKTSEISKAEVYKTYLTLSEICKVEVGEVFYSADLIVSAKHTKFHLQLDFEPSYPKLTPKLILKEIFPPPYQIYSVFFNCHPSLLNNKWDAASKLLLAMINDIKEVSKLTTTIPINSSPLLYNEIVDIIKVCSIDISKFYMDTNLPVNCQSLIASSINVNNNNTINNNGASTPTNTFFKGVGYSTGQVKEWSFNSSNLSVVDYLSKLSIALEKSNSENNTKTSIIDQHMADLVYFILNSIVVSPTLTLEEFFQNFLFYESIIKCVVLLPLSTKKYQIVETLSKLYQNFHPTIVQALETNEEKKAYENLEIFYNRLQNNNNNNNKNNNNNNSNNNTTHDKTNTDIQKGEINLTTNTPTTNQLTTPQKTTETSNEPTENTPSSHTNTTTTTTNSSSQSSFRTKVSSLQRNNNNKTIIETNEPFENHKYLNEMKTTSHLPAKWFRRLRIELSTMEESLPLNNVIVLSGIEVSQPNLLKILMFPESVDTPYCGGCFLFDCFIPHNYPDVPPKALLVTTGNGTVRFNPNLYHCGKVCLSLLGTWSGEKWNPKISNLTQVINSILFLIFVEEPYFNEPGYEGSKGTPSGIYQSSHYNYVIRLGTLRYGYLDHFKNRSELCPWILPTLSENWQKKGRLCAVKWATESSKQEIEQLIELIDKAVNEFLCE